MLYEIDLRKEHDRDRSEVREHSPCVYMLATLIRVIKTVLVQLVANKDQVALALLTFEHLHHL